MDIFILTHQYREIVANLNHTLCIQSKKIAATFFMVLALFSTADFQAQHNALDFDGVDDYVNIGNNLNLTSAISIEAWVKTDGLGSRQTILDKGYSSSGEPYYQYHVEVRSGGEVYFALSLNGTRKTTQTSTTLTAGQWHHIACVYNGSTIKIYIDGIEKSSTNATGSISTYSTSLYIGAYSGPGDIGSFDGLIDEVRIWSDERTASEISANKSIELNGNESNLVGYYKLNETDTNTVASNSASATGDSCDGTLTNMTGTEWTTSTAFPDSTAPTISSVTANWGDFLTEVEDDVNGTVTVVSSGAEDGQTVTLTLNSVNYTASVSSNSASITVTAAGLQALSNNTDYTLTTNVSDLAGNSADTFTTTTFRALNNPSTNNALAFDGTNDYVTTDINLPTGDFTYSAWVKFNTVSRKESIFSVGGDNELIIIKNTDGKLAVWIGGSEQIVESSATDTDWHHIALTRSGVNATLYRDGVSIGSSTSVGSGSLSFDNCDLLIASDSDNGCNGSLDDYLDGQIDELRIWDDVRTVSEILTNMVSELTGNESNLVGYYKFNEPDTNTVASNFASASGASYDGTLTNMTGTEWTTSTAFASAIETFTNGSGDGQWATASNWSSGSVPTSSTNVSISSGQTLTIGNSTAAAARTVTVDNGGSLTIAKNSDLTLSGNFTNNGTVTLNSDADEFASIIVGGSSTGDIIYNRYTNTVGSGEWDLIGSPVVGLSISSFVSTNSTPLATSGSIYAVGTYDNSNDTWTNYTSSTVGTAGNFDIGRGYQMATSSGATMAFTGTVATTDQTQSIINNAGNGGRRWNLVANPYPSYLNANTNAHASNNFLSVNSGVIDSNYSAIYGYDADGSGYTIYNNTNAATYIAPGQAFFVAAASSSATNLSFTEAMQTTTGGDDFIVGHLVNTSSELYLKLYEEQNLVGATKFYFDNNLSLGLDPGYDAGAYNQSSALASRLAEDDQGVNMGINSMGINSFEQTTIPIVVNRQAGTSFRISLEDLTIPESVEVFLEDTETQTFTDLRAGDFTLNPQSDLGGMGRFYLRLGNISLGGSDLEESYIRIYNPMDKEYITIEGLANIQKANVRLYNIVGQEILNKTLQTDQSTLNISTSGLTTGIYVIKLELDSTLISKKIMVN